ncbi:MAG: LptF/LptG family permease, partial [Solirubrobacteraceae bacterium]
VHARGGPDCPLQGILISESGESKRSFYAGARCGSLEDDPSSNEIAFVLHDGSIHFRDPDPTRYRRIGFKTMRTSLDISRYTDPPLRSRDLRFSEMLAAKQLPADDPDRKRLDGKSGNQLDLQINRRLAFPLASLLLAIVAVPLGIQPVRAGRSAGALTAIGVMALYWVLFTLGDMTAESGIGPPWLGIWTPNALVLVLGIWLVRRASRSDA